MHPNHWNSLEIAKLIAGMLTPVAIAILGIYLHRVTKRFEHLQWRSQKLIEKRLAVYDSLAPKLNDLFCYFTHVGNWRDVPPPTIVALKRSIDKEIHLAAPLFSKEFFTSLMALQDACFKTFGGWGRDACLRTEFDRRKAHYSGTWQPDWDKHFADDISSSQDVQTAYTHAMHVFSRDLGVREQVTASER